MIVHNLKIHVLCSQCRRFRYNLGPYQCKRGHIICSRCQPVTQVCPQCFIFVDVNDPIRCHYAVDFLMDKVPVPCIYNNNGCMEKDERGKIRQHVSICPFRMQANVGNVIEGAGLAGAGAIDGGTGNHGGEDDADSVLGADINDQNEETVGEAEGFGREVDASPVLVEDMIDQNEESVGAGSADIRNEHNYAAVIRLDDDDQIEENVGRAGGSGVEEDDGDQAIAADMNDENEETVGGGFVGVQNEHNHVVIPLSSDDDDQNEEAVGNGSVGVRNGNNCAVIPLSSDDDDQNEETVGGRSVGVQNENNSAVISLSSDDDDQNEKTAGNGSVGVQNENNCAVISLSSDDDDQSGENVGSGSAGLRNEDNHIEVVVLDAEDSNEETEVERVVDLVSEDETEAEEAVAMDSGNVEEVMETEGPAAVNADGDMETEEEQNQEAGSVEGGNVEGVEEEVDIGMEVEEVDHDDRMEEEENNGNRMEVDNVGIVEEDLGSGSSLLQRKGTRKRMRTQRYSPPGASAKATSAKPVKAKSRKAKRPYSTRTRVRKFKIKRRLKVATKSAVSLDDPTAQQPQSSSTTYEKETFECKPCEKQYSTKYNLIRHNKKRHQLQRPFQCSICSLKFWQRALVTNHLASYHSAPIVDKLKFNETEEAFALYCCCMFCDSRFIKKDKLRGHISNMHKDKYETSGGSEN